MLKLHTKYRLHTAKLHGFELFRVLLDPAFSEFSLVFSINNKMGNFKMRVLWYLSISVFQMYDFFSFLNLFYANAKIKITDYQEQVHPPLSESAYNNQPFEVWMRFAAQWTFQNWLHILAVLPDFF